jgi:hypothetical protein
LTPRAFILETSCMSKNSCTESWRRQARSESQSTVKAEVDLGLGRKD